MIRLTIGTTKISVISATRIVNIGSLGGGVREQVIFDLFQVQSGDPISILDFLSRQVSYRKYRRDRTSRGVIRMGLYLKDKHVGVNITITD